METYANTDIDVGLPGWARVAGHEAIASLPTDDLLVITAYNLGEPRPAEAADVQANTDLARVLCEMGGSVLCALGRERGGSHLAPSWAVTGLSLGAVQSLGLLIGQRVIFQVTQDELRTMTCDGKMSHAQPRVLTPASADAPCTVRIVCGETSWSVDAHSPGDLRGTLDLTKPITITSVLPGTAWLANLRVHTPEIEEIHEFLDEDVWHEYGVLAASNPERWQFNGSPLAAVRSNDRDQRGQDRSWCVVPWPEDRSVVVEHHYSHDGYTPGGGRWGRSQALRLTPDVALITWQREGDRPQSYATTGTTEENRLSELAEAPIAEELLFADEAFAEEQAAEERWWLSEDDAQRVLEAVDDATGRHGLTPREFVSAVANFESSQNSDTLSRIVRLSRGAGENLLTCLDRLEVIVSDIETSGFSDALDLSARILEVAPTYRQPFVELEAAIKSDTLVDWLHGLKRWSSADTRLSFTDAVELTLKALEDGAVVDRDQVVESLKKHGSARSTRLGFMAGGTEYHCWPDALGVDDDGLWLDPMAIGTPQGRTGWHRVRRDVKGAYTVELGGPVRPRRPDHTIWLSSSTAQFDPSLE